MNTSQIEAQFLSLFERVRISPPRDPIAAERGRRQFLKRVEALRPSRAFIILPRWSARRPAWAIASVLLASTLLLSGIGVARAASGALPNQTLYSVKIAVEDLQIAISGNDAADAYLLLQFSQRRIEEIIALVGQERFDQISIPTEHYQNELMQLTKIIAGLMESGDPRAEQLYLQFLQNLIEQEKLLSSLLETPSLTTNIDIQAASELPSKALANEAFIEYAGSIRTILPSWGKQGQTFTLVINGEGTHFGSNSTLAFGPGVTVNWIYAESKEQLKVNITIAENATLGIQVVSVLTDYGTIEGTYLVVDGDISNNSLEDEDFIENQGSDNEDIGDDEEEGEGDENDFDDDHEGSDDGGEDESDNGEQISSSGEQTSGDGGGEDDGSDGDDEDDEDDTEDG